MAAYLVIVRRAAPGRFEALADVFYGESDVTVVWDRRQGERRVGRDRPPTPDRRTRSRRRALPDTWWALDFLVTTGEASR